MFDVSLLISVDLVLALPAQFTGGDHEKSESDIIAEGTE